MKKSKSTCHHLIGIDQNARMDKFGFFAEPVNGADVPDYYEIVKQPMDFATMQRKLDEFEYTSAEDFKVRHLHYLR